MIEYWSREWESIIMEASLDEKVSILAQCQTKLMSSSIYYHHLVLSFDCNNMLSKNHERGGGFTLQ